MICGVDGAVCGATGGKDGVGGADMSLSEEEDQKKRSSSIIERMCPLRFFSV